MGTVWLVGAGPGDPGLMAVRAWDALARADALVHDGPLAAAVHDRLPQGCRVVPAGGPGAAPTLANLAAEVPTVVRLYAGDPLLDGGAAAEARALRDAGVPFRIVPGIPAWLGAAGYSGIGIGGRRLVVPAEGSEEAVQAADPDAVTVVSAPGSAIVPRLRRLVQTGTPGDAPVVVVERPTLPGQRTREGTAASLSEMGPSGDATAAVAFVGSIADRRTPWWEELPLAGKRVLVTRPRAQAADFAAALEELGAEVVAFPTIRLVPPEDPAELRAAAARAGEYDWVVFTSVNGVEHFWEALRGAGKDARAFGTARVCAIGPATAAALERRSVVADLVPEEYVAEAVVAALDGTGDLRGRRFLLPRADIARSLLPRELRARGAEVDEVAAYRTVHDDAGAEQIRARIAAGGLDVLTFTASSTVRSFVEQVGPVPGGATVASIGPITSGTARELGLPVHVQAEEYTIPGLVDALGRYFMERREE